MEFHSKKPIGRFKAVRVILNQEVEGVYVFIFTQASGEAAEFDYLQDSWDMAYRFCEEDASIPRGDWRPAETASLPAWLRNRVE